MEDLIEQYLFQQRHCPLPSVGVLEIKEGNAVAWHGDNKLSAPIPQVVLTNAEVSPDHFIAYIAAQKNIPPGEASVSLQKYCLALQKMKAYTEIKLLHTGKFYIDQSGKLVFKQDPLPKEYFPTVSMKRISRSGTASHNIRVGDNETTSEAMTEYYSEKAKSKKGTWWIPALILTAVIAGALYLYFKDHTPAENFGNIQVNATDEPAATYRSN